MPAFAVSYRGGFGKQAWARGESRVRGGPTTCPASNSSAVSMQLQPTALQLIFLNQCLSFWKMNAILFFFAHYPVDLLTAGLFEQEQAFCLTRYAFIICGKNFPTILGQNHTFSLSCLAPFIHEILHSAADEVMSRLVGKSRASLHSWSAWLLVFSRAAGFPTPSAEPQAAADGFGFLKRMHLGAWLVITARSQHICTCLPPALSDFQGFSLILSSWWKREELCAGLRKLWTEWGKGLEMDWESEQDWELELGAQVLSPFPAMCFGPGHTATPDTVSALCWSNGLSMPPQTTRVPQMLPNLLPPHLQSHCAPLPSRKHSPTHLPMCRWLSGSIMTFTKGD